MKKTLNRCLAFLFTFIIFSFNSISVKAASSTIQVSPPHQKIVLRAGETYNGTIKISNPSGNDDGVDINYSAFVGSYSPQKGANSKDDYGDADIDTKGTYNQIMDWIRIENNTGVLKANDSEIINFSINVPQDAPAGGQYATIIIRNDNPTDKSSTNAIMVQDVMQIASVLYAEVAGKTINSADAAATIAKPLNNIGLYVFFLIQ